MLFSGGSAEMTIHKLDNGFVLKWEHDEPEGDPLAARMGRRPRRGDYRGMEIFSDKKKLLKRLEELL